MGQGNLRTGRGPQSGCDAGNNFKLDIGFSQSCDFFPAAPEDQRITAFEPHYLQSRGSQIYHEEVDLFLADVLFSAALAHVMDLRVSWRQAEYLRADEIVVQYDVCLFQNPSGFERE